MNGPAPRVRLVTDPGVRAADALGTLRRHDGRRRALVLRGPVARGRIGARGAAGGGRGARVPWLALRRHAGGTAPRAGVPEAEPAAVPGRARVRRALGGRVRRARDRAV